jgi:hypothetical protein
MRWMPDRARHLGQARDRLLHLVRGDHHEVGQLVDDDHDVVEGLELLRPFRGRGSLPADDVVVLVNVAHPLRGQLADAPLHLRHRPFEDVGRDLGIGDHGGEEVGNVLVHAELEPLGVDEDHAHFVRRGLVEDARDHAVEADALAGAGGAGDEEVGHGGEVGDVGLAVDGLAQAEGEAGAGLVEGLSLQDLAQVDRLPHLVRDLDADGTAAADAVDTDRLRLQGQGEVVGQADDLRVLHSGVRLELVGRDHGAGMDLDHRAHDPELRRLGLQGLGLLEEPRLVHGRRELDLVHDRGGRQREVPAHDDGAAAALDRPRGRGDGQDGRGVVFRIRVRVRPLVGLRLHLFVRVRNGREGQGLAARPAPSPAAPGAFTLRTRGTLSPLAAAASSTASFSLLCFLMTSRRIRSLRRVSRKCAQAVRRACPRAARKRPTADRKEANENWVDRISDTNRDVATTM